MQISLLGTNFTFHLMPSPHQRRSKIVKHIVAQYDWEEAWKSRVPPPISAEITALVSQCYDALKNADCGYAKNNYTKICLCYSCPKFDNDCRKACDKLEHLFLPLYRALLVEVIQDRPRYAVYPETTDSNTVSGLSDQRLRLIAKKNNEGTDYVLVTIYLPDALRSLPWPKALHEEERRIKERKKYGVRTIQWVDDESWGRSERYDSGSYRIRENVIRARARKIREDKRSGRDEYYLRH